MERPQVRLVLGAICALSAVFGLAPAAAADCMGTGAGAVTLLGDGTEASPYLIGTPQGLSAVASGSCDHLGHYRLTADLTMPAAATSGSLTSNFRRIGTAGVDTFRGVLDGGGHTITGLVYRDETEDNIGLFSTLGNGARVRDLNLAGVDVDGKYAVGGLAGTAEPVDADILVERVSVTGTVRGYSQAGGIVGFILLGGSATGTATVRDSSADVAVALRADAGEEADGGGAVGAIRVNSAGTAVMDGVSASGDVTLAADATPDDERVGGLVGTADVVVVSGCPRTPLRIEDSHASGAVTTAEDGVGGLIGDLNVAEANCSASIQRSSATGAVAGRGGVGGLIGNLLPSQAGSSVALSDVYARGDVDRIDGGTSGRFGGLIGWVLGDAAASVTLTRAYATSRLVDGQGAALVGQIGGPTVTAAGGVFWDTDTAGVASAGISGATGSTTAAMTTMGPYTTAPIAWPMTTPWRAAGSTTDAWGWCASVDGGYPFLLSEYDAMPCQAPAAPTGLQATAGDGSATVAFTAGAAGDAAIASYDVSLDDGATWTARAPASAASPIVLTGLANGTAYRVRLRATSAVGAGAPSDAVSVTPAAAPAGGTTPKTAALALRRPKVLSGGRVRLETRVTGPGRLVLTGTVVRGRAKKPACRTTRTAKKAGTYALVCALDRKTRAALRTRAVTVRLVVAFTPTGGTATRQATTVKVPKRR